jgi:aerotaxis receptor
MQELPDEIQKHQEVAPLVDPVASISEEIRLKAAGVAQAVSLFDI